MLDNVKVGLHNHFQYSTLDGILRTPKYFKVEKAMNEKAMELLKVFDLDGECDFTRRPTFLMVSRESWRLPVPWLRSRSFSCLDEPAAGMNPNETAELMETIRFVRDHFGMTVLLIEHDMKLVSGICEKLTVLNFGQVLTEGPTSDVLNDKRVITAYLGE